MGTLESLRRRLYAVSRPHRRHCAAIQRFVNAVRYTRFFPSSLDVKIVQSIEPSSAPVMDGRKRCATCVVRSHWSPTIHSDIAFVAVGSTFAGSSCVKTPSAMIYPAGNCARNL